MKTKLTRRYWENLDPAYFPCIMLSISIFLLNEFYIPLIHCAVIFAGFCLHHLGVALILVNYASLRRMWNMFLPYLKRWFNLLTLFLSFQYCKTCTFISSVMATYYVAKLDYCGFCYIVVIVYNIVSLSWWWCEEFFTAFVLTCSIHNKKLHSRNCFGHIILFLGFS